MKKLLSPVPGFLATAIVALGNPNLPPGLTLEPGGVIRSNTQEDHHFEVPASFKSPAMHPIWCLDITMETGANPGSIQFFIGKSEAPDLLYTYNGGASLQRTVGGELPEDATPEQGTLRLMLKIYRNSKGFMRVDQTTTTGGATTRTVDSIPLRDTENIPLNAWDAVAIRLAGDASVRVDYKIMTQGTLLMVR